MTGAKGTPIASNDGNQWNYTTGTKWRDGAEHGSHNNHSDRVALENKRN